MSSIWVLQSVAHGCAEIWVVMAMGRGAAPSARIEGEGLDAEWILGQRRVNWNAAALRIESAPADEAVSGFSMIPLGAVANETGGGDLEGRFPERMRRRSGSGHRKLSADCGNKMVT